MRSLFYKDRRLTPLVLLATTALAMGFLSAPAHAAVCDDDGDFEVDCNIEDTTGLTMNANVQNGVTVTIDDGVDIQNKIDGQNFGDGTVTFAGSATITTPIGSGSIVDAVNFTGAGDVSVNEAVRTQSSIDIDKPSGMVILGDAGGAGFLDVQNGDLTITNGTLTFGALGGSVSTSGNTVVGANGQILFHAHDGQFDFPVINNGTITTSGGATGIFANSLTNSATITIGSGSSLNTQAAFSNENGSSVALNGGTMTLGGVSTFKNGSSLTAAHGSTINGAGAATFQSGSTMTVNGTVTKSAGNTNLNTGSNLVFALGGANDGFLNITGGTTTVQSGVNVGFTIADPSAITDGESFTLITRAAGTNLNTAGLFDITQPGGLLRYTDISTAASFIVRANLRNADDFGLTGNGGNAITPIIQAAQANAGLFSTINGFSDSQISTLANQAAPSPSPYAHVPASAQQQTQETTAVRLASLRDGDSETGMSAGDSVGRGWNLWMRAIAADQQQGDLGGIAGYDSSAFGGLGGIDTALSEDLIFGISAGYVQSEVDGNDAASTSTDIDSYQIGLYTTWEPLQRLDGTPGFYIDGMLGLALNRNDTVNTLSGLGARNGSFDSYQYMGRLETGMNARLGGGFSVTPKISAQYTHVDFDGYTETGDTGLNRTVQQDDYNAMVVGATVGMDYTVDMEDGWRFVPELHVGVRHDLEDDIAASTSSFTGGGAAFETNGLNPDDTSYVAGAGFSLYTGGTVSFQTQYEYEGKDQFDSHAGFAEIKISF